MSWPWPRLVIRSNGFYQSETNTAVTTGSEDFDAVFRSCFSDTMNNNLSVTTVNIVVKVLKITGDTMDLVKEACAVLEKHFNVVLESKIEEGEAGAVEAVLPALPSEDVVAGVMETDSGQATEMPTLNCSEGGGDEDTGAEVLETEAHDQSQGSV